MLNINTKNYEVVSKDNKEFNDLFLSAWNELGISPEYFSNSDYLLVKNKYNKSIATVEIAKYDAGYECKELEDIFNFKQFQNDSIQLIYMDKISIAKAERGNPQNMIALLNAIFIHTMAIRNGKKQVVIGLLRTPFYKFLKRILDLDIIQLSEEINGETPVYIDLEVNAAKLKSGQWIKL